MEDAMSSVVVLTPIIIGSWPAITAAITASIGTLGFSLAKTASLEAEKQTGDETTRAEIEVEDSEVLAAAAGSAQQVIVERQGVQATFSRDARGTLKVCMEGHGYSKAQLKAIGEELLGRVTQQFVYHRIINELKDRHMAIVGEEVSEDRTVKIRVRNF
jgi:hypothetical protein